MSYFRKEARTYGTICGIKYAQALNQGDKDMFDTSRIHPMLDKVQTYLGQWLEGHLKQIRPADWWDRCVMDVLAQEQRENVLNDGAKNPSELDLATQISVFRGNWASLRRKFHLNPQLYDDAVAVKRIRNKYSHKTSSGDYNSRFEHDMETVRFFLKGLGAPTEVAKEVESVNEEESNARANHMRFDNIIGAARAALPVNVRRAPWIGIEHGVVPLDTEQKLDQYLAAYGKMHVEKLRMAFDSLDDADKLLEAPISIIDWGCGQALATCCAFDWMHDKGIDLASIRRVYLVEPSRLALDRAQNNVAEYQRRSDLQLEVSAIHRFINDITAEDFDIGGITTTLHLFSNILDIDSIDLEKLAEFIKHTFTGRQIFCCVGPQNNGAYRIAEFAEKLGITQEQIEANFMGRLAHCKGTVLLLTFVIETGKASVVKKVNFESVPAVVDNNIALQRLLRRYTPEEDVLDRILQFYRMTTELEQLKEPKVDNPTPFVMKNTGNSIIIPFGDNCTGVDESAFANACRSFATACIENVNRRNRFPKDIHCALEMDWDEKIYPLLHYIKPVSELDGFDYENSEFSVSLSDFSVNIACADLLEMSDEDVAAIEQTLHDPEITLVGVAARIQQVIGPSAGLNTTHIKLSLCDKNPALAQTYAELSRMKAADIRRNSLMEAFLENAEMDNEIEPVLPDELISAVPMDDPQRKAVAHALEHRVSVVVGPPGCGKTQLLLNLLANALVRGKKVLVASKNNKAVDNVCDRFKPFDENGCFLRFGPKKYVRDTTLPALSRLLNCAQAQDYDEAQYHVAFNEFRNAIAAVKARRGLESDLAKHKTNVESTQDDISELDSEIKSSEKVLDDIREECIADARTQKEAESEKMRIAVSELEDRIAKLETEIGAERERSVRELNDFQENHSGCASLEDSDFKILSELIAKLQRLGSDMEYRIGGIHGLFVRKATIAKYMLDAIWELPCRIQEYLRDVDARRSISDFTSRRDVVSFCGKLVNGLLAALKYRKDVEKFQGDSKRTIARLSEDLKNVMSQKKEIDTQIAANQELLSCNVRFTDWALREFGNQIDARLSKTKANLASLEESMAREKRRLNEERSSAMEIEETLQNHAKLVKRVTGVDFGQRLISLALAHYLHAHNAPMAISEYKAFLPDQLWQNDALTPACRFLNAIRLNSVTSLSVKNAFPMVENLFDILVIDEASQCDVASALPLILRAKQIVVIGDPKQLRHISKLDESEELAIKRHLRLSNLAYLKYAESSFWDYTRNWIPWCGNDSPSVLGNHYRCHHDIIGYSNEMFYRDLGGLQVCTPRRNDGPNGGIIWRDVRGFQESDTKNINEAEAQMCANLAMGCSMTYPNCTIGIVTPFTDQAKRINTLLSPALRNSIIVDTVHRFQGDEKDIMIYSLVVTDNSPDSKIRWIDRKSPNLVNVAVTRARRQLVIVGNRSYIRTHSRSDLPLGHLEMYVSALEAAAIQA